MPDNILPWVFLFVGLAARILIPWLTVRLRNPDDNGSKWTWRYVWPQLLTFAVLILGLPLIVGDLEEVSSLSYSMAYLAGWGAADSGKFLLLDLVGIGKK